MDDIANYVPARLSAVLMLIGSLFCLKRAAGIKHGIKIWRKDCRKLSSPNAAHPESAAAGLLGVKLGGSDFYGGILEEKPYIGDELKPIERIDIRRFIKLMYASELLLGYGIFVLCIW